MAVCMLCSPLIALLSFLSSCVDVPWIVPASLLVLACIAAMIHRKVYRKSYDMKEQPVNERPRPVAPDEWESFPCDSHELEFRASLYEREFFLNALVHPRSVFSRISEYVSPGRRMLDCDIHYEVKAQAKHGTAIRGLSDFESRPSGCTVACELIVPVTFQKRGELTISQKIYNSAGKSLPIVKQRDMTDAFIEMLNVYMRDAGSTA